MNHSSLVGSHSSVLDGPAVTLRSTKSFSFSMNLDYPTDIAFHNA
jgi:hypothetical protein